MCRWEEEEPNPQDGFTVCNGSSKFLTWTKVAGVGAEGWFGVKEHLSQILSFILWTSLSTYCVSFCERLRIQNLVRYKPCPDGSAMSVVEVCILAPFPRSYGSNDLACLWPSISLSLIVIVPTCIGLLWD